MRGFTQHAASPPLASDKRIRFPVLTVRVQTYLERSHFHFTNVLTGAYQDICLMHAILPIWTNNLITTFNIA
ncbi:hypothetical protein ILYODFUR_002888 [Ilyodon furcidens]|uniref:Uncharacterized protein n=1 Tax=Ilyodon furcidens TaxID=33524 RepID=A0ABV0VAJ8_9TELE